MPKCYGFAGSVDTSTDVTGEPSGWPEHNISDVAGRGREWLKKISGP